MNNDRLCKMFTVFFIACLSIPTIFPLLGMNQSDSNLDTQFFLSDDYSPVFDLTYQPTQKTYDTGGQPLTVAVEFWVGVDDLDGIDRVVARYKTRDSSDWQSVDMEFVEIPEEYTRLYTCHAFNYTLDADHTRATWDVKFWAVDTFGNSAESQATYLTISEYTIWDSGLGDIAQFSMTILMVILISVVIIAFPVTMVRKLR